MVRNIKKYETMSFDMSESVMALSAYFLKRSFIQTSLIRALGCTLFLFIFLSSIGINKVVAQCNDIGFGSVNTNTLSICVGGNAGTIVGSNPSGGESWNWQVSTVSSSGPFNDLVPAVISQNYVVTATYINTPGTYYFIRQISGNPGCTTPSDVVTLTVFADPTAPNPAGASICTGSTTTLNVIVSGGVPETFSYQWQQMATNCASPTNVGTNSSSYTTAVLTTGTYYYRVIFSSSGSGCGSYTTGCATVVVNALPTVACPANSSVCISDASFALTGGSPVGGTYSGTGVSGGNFNPASAGAGTHTITYSYTDGNGCTNTCSFNITVIAAPTTANAGPDQTGASTCGLTTVTLVGNTPSPGTGQWSIISGAGGTITTPSSPTSTFTGVAGSTYTLSWTISNSPCPPSTDDVTITFNQNPTAANAGPDQTGAPTCGLTMVTLAANTPALGTGSWSIISGAGGTITTLADPNSTFTGVAGSTYTLRWTTINGPCTSTDDVVITFNLSPTTADAGPDQTVCTTTATLAGNAPSVGTGVWTLVSGAGSINTPGSPTSGITGLGVGANVFRWTISNSCGSSFDDVIITNATPTIANAGPDQTGTSTCGLTTVTLAANTPTSGTGFWTIVSGTGGTVTDPTSPTSIFTGVAGTTYTLSWTISNPPCSPSSDNVVIAFNENPTMAVAGPDQAGAATCGLTMVTLAANTPTVGTGSWSIISGAGGSIVTPTSPTSIFNGVAGNTYTLHWTISNTPCPASTDDVVITFNRNPTVSNAGPDQSICLTTATLAGNTPAVGVGMWTLISGAGSITLPSSPTSGITGLGVGANVFRWTISNSPCPSSFDEVTITRSDFPTPANAGPDQTGAATCDLTSVTLAGNTPTNGTGSWSIVSGAGGSIMTPSSPTSIFNGTAGTTYTLRWTISNPPCAASIDDVVITFNRNPTTANAGPDQTVCATTATLAGNTPTVGTGSWTLISGAGTITTPGSPTSGITALGIGANVFRWTIANSPCPSSFDEVTITRSATPTTAAAGPDQTGAATCGLTIVTLAGNAPGVGTGLWTIVSGTGGTITTPTSPTSTFTGIAGNTYTLSWTISNPPCTPSTDNVVITFNLFPTTSAAGPDQSVCSTTATLAGNTPTVGTGTWTLIGGTGTITTPGSPTSGVTALGVGANTFRWTITNAPCGSSFDDVVITNSANPSPANAGPDQTGASTCGLTTVTLAGNAPGTGTGLWAIVSGVGGTINSPTLNNSTFTGIAGNTYTLSWTISNPPCPSTTDNVVITFNQNPTTSIAGSPQSVCLGGNVTLAANTPTVGTGVWSIVSGPNTSLTQFSSTSNPSATFTPTLTGSYVLRWSISNAPCITSFSNVTITVNPLPTINTSATAAAVCFSASSQTTTLSYSSTTNAPSTYSISWNAAAITAGFVNVTNASLPASPITLSIPANAPAATYTGTITVRNANGCVSTGTTFTVTVNPSPNLTVNPSSASFCSGNSVQLIASGASSYVWSPPDGLSIDFGAIVNANPETTTTYTVTGTGSNGCTSTFDVTIDVAESPEGELSSSPPVCYENNSGTLELTNYSGDIIDWEFSTDGGATWSSQGNNTTSYTYNDLTVTTIYRVRLSLNGCDGFSNVGIIPVNPLFIPTVTATPDTICLGQSATLTASGYGQPPFPLEDFGNANPAGWTGNDANNNNEDDNTDWGETGCGKVFNGVTYCSNAPPTNTKFMIVAGETDEADFNSILGSPPFSLVGTINPVLCFWTALNFNAGTIGYVQISIDGGATWITPLTFTGPTNIGNPNGGWVQYCINLSAYIGQPNVMIQFNYFGTAGSNWGIDNVGIIATFQPVTYQWSPLAGLTPANGQGQTVTTTPTTTGIHQYCVVATSAVGCESPPVCVDVNVLPIPTCSITGPASVCPGSTNMYIGPAGAGYSYQWSISGGSTISGSSTGQTVSVLASNGCNTSYVLSLVTTLNGCSSAPCTLSVIVLDNIPPVPSVLPGPATIECSAPPGWTIPTATDNCSSPTFTFVDVTVSGACTNEYAITRTWTATDACGNSATTSQIINFEDTIPPVIPALPGPSTIECSTTPSWTTPIPTDNCGTPALTFSDSITPGSCVNKYFITRTWTATDGCGNVTTAEQIINVDDTTPPEILCPADLVFECDAQVPPPLTTFTAFINAFGSAVDNCALDPSSFIIVTETDNGTCPRLITRTYQIADSCGNTGQCVQSITVDDITPPLITCPADLSLQYTDPIPDPLDTYTEFINGGGSVSDNCGFDTTTFMLSITDSGSGTIPRVITRTYSIGDLCGNSAQCTQVISIGDVTPPEIICPPDLTVACFADIPSPYLTFTDFVNGGGSATDTCGIDENTFSGTEVDDNGTCPLIITRTYSISDSCGNVATCVQIITVDDNILPVIICPADLTVGCIGDVPVAFASYNEFVSGGGNASDNCGLDETTFAVSETDNGLCPLIITRTYSIADSCSNIGQCVQLITINDNTAPLITCPVNITVACSVGVPAPDTALVDASDDCDSVLIEFVSDVSDGMPCTETFTRTYRATDLCGNTSECIQLISILPPATPVFNPVSDLTITCAQANVFTPVNLSYTNGESGSCLISGTVVGVVRVALRNAEAH